jgi:putative transposase
MELNIRVVQGIFIARVRVLKKLPDSFPNEEAELMLIYQVLGKISRKYTMPVKEWKSILDRFAFLFGEKLTYA